MTHLTIEANLAQKLIAGMNSKTIIILNYLFQQARQNNNILILKYKDIEQALQIGHTTVGNNMRFLIKIGAIEKVNIGTYRINPALINICTVEEELS